MRARRLRVRALMPWVSLLAGVLAIGLLVWYLLGRGRASALDLVAWDRSGVVGDQVRLDPAPNDPLGAGTPRVPLVLGLRNPGSVALQVTRVALSVPSWLRVERDDGTALEGEADGGNPLMRYVIEFAPLRLEPGAAPEVLPGFGRLWIRPFASPWRCTLDDDGLPAFVPAPPLDPQRLARGTVFWSVEEERSSRRATGTLELSLDPALFEGEPVERPPAYPPRVLPADSPHPDLATLPVLGTRTIACGSMSEPLTLTSTAYGTQGGGRIVSVAIDEGQARLLFDLNGDDTVEAEAWSSTDAGRIDRVRRTRFSMPRFLLPPPPPPEPVPDSTTTDSLAAPADPLPADTTRAADTTRVIPAPPDTTGSG